MSLTAHYIDKDWNLITRCLRTAYHPEAHTAVNLAHFFRESLNQYGLKTGYVVTMTTDSAANMIAATREAGKSYFLSEQLTNAMFIHSSVVLIYNVNRVVELVFVEFLTDFQTSRC